MRLVWLGLFLPVACAAAYGPGRVHVSLAGKRPAAVLGKPWSVRLAVRPTSFQGRVVVIATGSSRLQARATRRRGQYRVRLSFTSAGSWRLTARAGGRTSRLGTVRVAPLPLVFSEPTSIDLEPDGTLLLVENNPGRLLQVDPATGLVTVLVPALTRPYAVVRAPSGDLFLAVGSRLERLDPGGGRTTVVDAGTDIGPLAAAPNGDVYFATATQLFRIRGGSGAPVRVAPGVQLSSPHGLAVAADGALLVSDTGNGLIRRIDPSSGATSTLAELGQPDGLDVAADGSLLVVDEQADRVVHLSASGVRLGLVGPVFTTPYDVEAAPGGATYVLEAGPAGRIRRVAANGSVTTVVRRRLRPLRAPAAARSPAAARPAPAGSAARG